MKILKSFYRVYLRKTELEASKEFYMALQGVDRPHHEFHYAEFNLDIVGIGSILLLAGDKADTERFEPTKLTCLVDDLEAVRAYFIQTDIKIIDDIKVVPSGHNLRAMSPDGTIAEYVQHSDDFKRKMAGNAYD
ncbi:VOC family protein [Streptomyces alboniger]|uniref:Glyoxalase/bleomycin resistance/dioxygenase family protein n=1 Tax=Streptomyces alboniger TaxID=132473 RepID=A0A5J6HTV3_STRAD|nr:glyoxalase/bleomycin resistance/dioxygenase family protein [Streptomyces alboniger]QEV21863.1 glyoxalase/bleomycin resistance/dioxygenase family protein [Streptomyces alboniger]